MTKITEKAVTIPTPGEWISKDIDPKLIELMSVSKDHYQKYIKQDSPLLDHFKDLDRNQIKEWEKQFNEACDFLLTVREYITFFKGVYTLRLFNDYRASVVEENDRLRQIGQPTLRFPFGLDLRKQIHGISAVWTIVKFVRRGIAGKLVMRSEYIRQTESGAYSKFIFKLASPSVRDFLFAEIETNLTALRQQTKWMVSIRRQMQALKDLDKKFFKGPGA